MKASDKSIYIPYTVTIFIIIIELSLSFNSILLPSLIKTFEVSIAVAEMSMSISFFSLGVAGIVYASLSNSFGRKPILIFSVILFCVSTCLCAISGNIGSFLLARFLQGIASGAGWVIGNACIKDVYHGTQYVRIMNVIHAIAGIVPAVGPIIGSYLIYYFSWRICCWFIFCIASIYSIFMFYFHVETIRIKDQFKYLLYLEDYIDLFRSRQFVIYCFVKVLMVSLLFAEVSILPLIFIEYLAVKQVNYGFYVFPVFMVYIITIMVNQLLPKIRLEKLVMIGLKSIILSNFLILVLSLFYSLSALNIQLLKSFCYIGWAMIFGNCTAQIVSAIENKSAIAAAVMIVLEMFVSAISVTIVTFFFDSTIIPLSVYMLIITILSYMVFSIYKP